MSAQRRGENDVAAKGSAPERLALIGTGPVADALHERATDAGWDADRVPLFPAESPGGGGALVDAPAEALVAATIVAIATPASAHHALTILLQGALNSDAVVLLVPGQPGGALQFAHALGPDAPTVAETSWIPFVDLPGGKRPKRVDIASTPLATVPARQARAVARRVAPLFAAQPVKNALWTALHAPDVVLRTIPVVVGGEGGGSDTLAERLGGRAEGVVTAVELERQQVAKALGLEVPGTAPWLAGQLGTTGSTLASALGPLGATRVPEYRHPEWLAELTPFGLVPLQAIAADAGVAVPCISALVTMADAMLGNDYVLGGRSARIMGLDGE